MRYTNVLIGTMVFVASGSIAAGEDVKTHPDWKKAWNAEVVPAPAFLPGEKPAIEAGYVYAVTLLDRVTVDYLLTKQKEGKKPWEFKGDDDRKKAQAALAKSLAERTLPMEVLRWEKPFPDEAYVLHREGKFYLARNDQWKFTELVSELLGLLHTACLEETAPIAKGDTANFLETQVTVLTYRVKRGKVWHQWCDTTDGADDEERWKGELAELEEKVSGQRDKYTRRWVKETVGSQNGGS